MVEVVEVPACEMSNADFNEALSSIESKSFSDSRMTIAKQVADNHCLTVKQIKAIAGIFDFEDGKLEFAKYAYDACSEQNKYYLVNDVFNFESSIDELQEYISKR